MEHIYSPCHNSLHGSHNFLLSINSRWVWWQLNNLAGLNERAGYVEQCEGMPYTLRDLAYELHVPADILGESLKELEKNKFIGILDKQQDNVGIIILLKWNDWQVIKIGDKKPAPEKKKKYTKEEIDNMNASKAMDMLDSLPEHKSKYIRGERGA